MIHLLKMPHAQATYCGTPESKVDHVTTKWGSVDCVHCLEEYRFLRFGGDAHGMARDWAERQVAQKTCFVCKCDPGFYMLKDDVWPWAKDAGWACLPCVESKLGRKVKATDFKDVLGNRALLHLAKNEGLL